MVLFVLHNALSIRIMIHRISRDQIIFEILELNLGDISERKIVRSDIIRSIDCHSKSNFEEFFEKKCSIRKIPIF